MKLLYKPVCLCWLASPQQMILVLLPVGSRLHDRVVGKVFQIQPDFTFQQPHERIHPTDDIHYLTGNDINGMKLTCMSQFMCQDFLSLIFFQLRKIDKNPNAMNEKGLFG